jgi:hypothetical protein
VTTTAVLALDGGQIAHVGRGIPALIVRTFRNYFLERDLEEAVEAEAASATP